MKAPDSEDQTKSLHEIILQNCSEDDKKQQLIEAIENGADIDARDTHGHTALHLSSFCEHSALIPVLLSHGANPNCLDSAGNTALHLLCLETIPDRQNPEYQYADILERVAQSSLDLGAQNYQGLWPIDIALDARNLIAIRVLVAAGVDPNTLRAGETLLWHASTDELLGTIKTLLALGADQTLFLSEPPIKKLIDVAEYRSCHILISQETGPYLASKRQQHQYPEEYDEVSVINFATTFEMYVHIKSCCHYLSTHPERAFRSLQRALSINRDLAFTEFKNILDDVEKNIVLTPSEKVQLIQLFIVISIGSTKPLFVLPPQPPSLSDEQHEELFLLVYRLVMSNYYEDNEPSRQKHKQLLAQFGLTLAALNRNSGYVKRFSVPMLAAAANSPLKDKNGEEIEICSRVALSDVLQHLDREVVDELITILVANVMIARTKASSIDLPRARHYDYLINALKCLFQHGLEKDEMTPHPEAKSALSSPFIFCATPMQPGISGTPLHRLCQHFPWADKQARLLSVGELLIANGADVNAHDYTKPLTPLETPLLEACVAGDRRSRGWNKPDFNSSLILLLFNHGADPSLHSPSGLLPFEIAAKDRADALQHTLIENEKDPYLKAIIDESGYLESKDRSFYPRFAMAARIKSCCSHLTPNPTLAFIVLQRALTDNYAETVDEICLLLNDERPTLQLNMSEKQQLLKLLIAADNKNMLGTPIFRRSNVSAEQHQRLANILTRLINNAQDNESEHLRIIANTLSVLSQRTSSPGVKRSHQALKTEIISMLITTFSDLGLFDLNRERPLLVLNSFICALNKYYLTKDAIFINSEERMEINAWITSGFLGRGRREFLKEQRREKASTGIKNIEQKRVAA